MARRAVFVDRDGVLIEDVDLLMRKSRMRLLEGVPEALSLLAAAGFALLAVSNQTVVARGLATEEEVRELNGELDRRLVAAGGPPLDGHFFCPHHPNATLERYRVDCDCRKPRPGLLVEAAGTHGIELARSFMVGDRITDVVAGQTAGCRAVQVRTGRHADPPIVTTDPVPAGAAPDHIAADLRAAAEWILAAGDER